MPAPRLLLLHAGAGDAFDRERRPAGFLGDLAVLLDQIAARGLVAFGALRIGPGDLRRHAPVGALRAVLIDDVEEDEFAFGVAAGSFCHAGLWGKGREESICLRNRL